MYFDLEDRRPDTPILDRPLTRLEQLLLTIIAYLLLVIGIIVYPRLPFVKAAEAARLKRLDDQREKIEAMREPMQFVFAKPKVEVQRLPDRPKFLSDESHKAQAPEKAPVPKTDIPMSRGNTPDRTIADASRPQPEQPAPQPTAPPASNPNALALPTTAQSTIARNEPSKNPMMENRSPGPLSDAIRNVNRYTQGETLQNVQGNSDFGPSFQFDSKGVDFGSWLRRFKAQVYRNWLIPYAAMALHGHTVLRFTIHKDGSVSELIVLQPSSVDAFTKAAFNAIKASNPTVPLPQEYPDESMVMTVIFYYNEVPPNGGVE
ncbi:MAG TPA: TonB family protein [Vicinamibacterales bacterium]|jgi:TonB family protein